MLQLVVVIIMLQRIHWLGIRIALRFSVFSTRARQCSSIDVTKVALLVEYTIIIHIEYGGNQKLECMYIVK